MTETAGDIADDLGWDALTLAAVADRLGVRVPSLYKHVASLDALRHAVAVDAAGALADALTAATVGVAGPHALARLCAAYRAYALEHPGRYAATQRASASNPGADRTLVVVNAVLAGYGITGTDAVDAARAVRSALHGFTALESTAGFGLPRDVDRSFARLVAGLGVMLAAWPAGGEE
ncbi:TetR-like C-terminal domain-containing protein [Microbacter sp. GSS18]|nr:TetR-like C-terminal domain-containing protein [Microbacter sp. GSS18]